MFKMKRKSKAQVLREIVELQEKELLILKESLMQAEKVETEEALRKNEEPQTRAQWCQRKVEDFCEESVNVAQALRELGGRVAGIYTRYLKLQWKRVTCQKRINSPLLSEEDHQEVEELSDEMGTVPIKNKWLVDPFFLQKKKAEIFLVKGFSIICIFAVMALIAGMMYFEESLSGGRALLLFGLIFEATLSLSIAMALKEDIQKVNQAKRVRQMSRNLKESIKLSQWSLLKQPEEK